MLPLLNLFTPPLTQEGTPSENESTKSKPSSISSKISSFFGSLSRKNSPVKKSAHSLVTSPQSLWNLATNFFVNQKEDKEDAKMDTDQEILEHSNAIDHDLYNQRLLESSYDFPPSPVSNKSTLPNEGIFVATDQRARVEDADDNESIPEMQPGSDEDNDDESDTGSNHEGEGEAQDNLRSTRWMAPTIINAKKAHEKIKGILKPPRTTGNGHKDPGLDLLLRSRLEGMSHFLWAYINPNSKTYNKWSASSLLTATALERGPWFA